MHLHTTRFGQLAKRFLLLVVGIGMLPQVVAHPMPNSVVQLTVQATRIDAEVQIPLMELQAAWGHAANDSSAQLVMRYGPALRAYLKEHIRPTSPTGQAWQVSVGALAVHELENPITGAYRELTAQVRLLPPAGEGVRQLVLAYNVVLHQVVTHKILVSVHQDWARGQVADEPPTQVGVIELDIVNNRIPPLPINLAAGSMWTGFAAMVQLGIRHIAEGTDHLLFLLVLLLPAPLLLKPRHLFVTGYGVELWHPPRWGDFGGVRHSLLRLLKIVTAFTLGHSLTLLLGTLGWVRLPSQPVEVLIAVSILVSAGHAVQPLFPGREAYVAAGFGLVHGLAFASTLTNLHLDVGPMALSVLGFNLGIELMQLLVIVLTFPWLLLLSCTPTYPAVRVGGALVAGLAAGAWIIERTLLTTTPFSDLVARLVGLAPWLLAVLVTGALLSYWHARGQFTAFRSRKSS